MSIRSFTIEYFDFDWYPALTAFGKLTLSEAQVQGSLPARVGRIINADQFNRQEAGNIASYYQFILRETRQVQYTGHAEINNELLKTLAKEYHF